MEHLPEFEIQQPKTAAEAVILGAETGARYIGGGTDFVPNLRRGLETPITVVDISAVSEMQAIEETSEGLRIGASVTLEQLISDERVNQDYSLLVQAAETIAGNTHRYSATVGGNLAHSDPANDHPATMLAYNAEIIALGPAGTRVIPIDDFFTGLFENALDENEILTQIRLPRPGPHSGGAYLKVERKVGDYAISAVAVQLTMVGDTCTGARIGLTNLSPVPMRAKNAEQARIGQVITPAVLEAAGQAAAAECNPSADLRGSVDYKRDLTRVLTKRALTKAVERAKGA